MKGAVHPITQIYRVAVATLGDMGFDIISAPEVDTPWHNFDGLRLTPEHPARLGHKEFTLTNGKMLRTHVSMSADVCRSLNRMFTRPTACA